MLCFYLYKEAGTMSVILRYALILITFSPASIADQSINLSHLRDNPILVDLSKKLRASPTIESWKTQNAYVIQDGDTLNNIIDKTLGHFPIKRNILRQAIVELNPHAFKRGNPNWMFRGATLQLPKIQDVEKIVFSQPPPPDRESRTNQAFWVRYP